MKKTIISAALIVCACAAFAQGPFHSDTHFSKGDIVPDGLVIIHCDTPDEDLSLPGRIDVELDERLSSDILAQVYQGSMKLNEEDLFFGVDAGDYRLVLTQQGQVILDKDFELTSRIQDYTIHFHDLNMPLKALEENPSFLVFPNPTAEQLRITGLPSAQLQIEIRDEQGRLVSTLTKPADETNFEMSMSSMDNGVYTVHLTGMDGSALGLKKVIVEK